MLPGEKIGRRSPFFCSGGLMNRPPVVRFSNHSASLRTQKHCKIRGFGVLKRVQGWSVRQTTFSFKRKKARAESNLPALFKV
jgi:hypothetical protein